MKKFEDIISKEEFLEKICQIDRGNNVDKIDIEGKRGKSNELYDWIVSQLDIDKSEKPRYVDLPFNLETALEHPEWVITKGGCPVEQLTEFNVSSGPTLVGIMYEHGDASLMSWYESGLNSGENGDYNLILRKPIEKVKKWVATYHDDYESRRITTAYLYDSFKEAQKSLKLIHKNRETCQIHEIEVEE